MLYTYRQKGGIILYTYPEETEKPKGWKDTELVKFVKNRELALETYKDDEIFDSDNPEPDQKETLN